MNQEQIGKFIAELRKEKNMTQQELAEKIGVTDRAISNWENGNFFTKLFRKYKRTRYINCRCII